MRDKIITSPSNPLFKKLKSLLTSKGVRSELQCLVPGAKLIQEILDTKKEQGNQKLKLSPLSLVAEQSSDSSRYKNIQKIELSKELFNELDSLGTGHPLLLCQIPDPTSSDFSREPTGLEVIAPLQDPQNMGALIRSCAAFGIERIHLTHESCNPYLPKSLKSAANGILFVEFNYLRHLNDLNLLTKKKENHHNLFILESQGKDLREVFKPNKPALHGYLLLGEEGQGHKKIKEVLKNQPIHSVSVPTQNVESLNATVASSIFLYEWCRHRSN
jgi:TrmH family RNA methyltransferase